MPVKKGKEKLGGVWINLETVIILECVFYFGLSQVKGLGKT